MERVPARPQPPLRESRDFGDAATGSVIGSLIGAVTFGYYGFFAGLSTEIVDSVGAATTVPLWIAFLWVLRGSSILFLASAGLACLRAPGTALISGLCGLAATAGLAGIFIWDLLDNQYTVACHPLLLLILIAWNGFGSITSMREALRANR